MDAYSVIAANHPGSGSFDETSFRACLYENATWSQDEYWKVEWALYQLAGTANSSSQLRWQVFRLFSSTFALFAAHFDPSDVYTIKNLKNTALREIMERFRLVFEGFFAGEMPTLESFEHRNPMLASGS